MTRYKLTIEYDGTDYVGWQRQDNGPSIQAAIEAAIKGFCGEEVLVYGAGRTDSGVHATGQAAHCDIARDTDADTVRDALNHYLHAAPISILTAQAVDDEFHARFSATGRRYLYRILNRRPPPALEARHVWWVPAAMDADAMHTAAQELVGKHDFTSFRASICQANSPIKTLDALNVSRAGEEIHVTAAARSFLHHQVRNMVGTLVLVGEGKWTVNNLCAALLARDRSAAGPTAPASGLFLTEVVY